MILVTQKAANTCNYCRIRKQRCDRTIPSCSRCIGKFRQCDYTWANNVPNDMQPNAVQATPLFVQRGDCSSDLSTRGRDELLQAAAACMNHEPGSANKFSELVSRMFDSVKCTVSRIMEEHTTSIHQWCPLLDEELLRRGRDGMYDECPPEMLPNPLELLCVLMLTRSKSSGVENSRTSVLYTTVMQVLAIIQAAGEVSLSWFRAGMLVAVYECSQGMAKQAFITLSSCVASFDLIKLDFQKPGSEACSSETVASLDAAIIMLDRMISLSSISESLPLACPSRHPLSMHIANTIEPAIPPPSPTPYASSPRKVHIRAIVSLAAGRVLDYAHHVRRGIDPSDTYDEVDAAMSLVIKKLVDKPEPHTWLHCDAIAMAFCSHLLLQQNQVEKLEARGMSLSDPALAKALMALQYCRRMAWDMVHVMIGLITKEDDLPYLPFAGVCCVIRAAVAVLETRKYVDEVGLGMEDLHSFALILGWFAKRWSVGVEYFERTQKLLASELV